MTTPASATPQAHPAAPAHPLQEVLAQRIAIIDGATGTTIRTYGMTEADIRGERFRDAGKDLLNNGDLFSLTQPAMMGDIHRRFLEAGADIIETNTFGATTITQSEFFVDDPREHGGRKDPAFYQRVIEDPFLQRLAWDINEQSARQCREWADRVADATGRRRFVAGAIGPLTVSLSNSPDADDAGFRVVTFDQVRTAYMEQVRALIAGGSDLLLVETIFDSLNAKAALVAIQRGVRSPTACELPIMISAAVGRGGETMISAQTTEAFWNAVAHVHPRSRSASIARSDPTSCIPFLDELAAKATSADLVPIRTRACRTRSRRRASISSRRTWAEAPRRLRQGRAPQHRGGLLRQHAGAHRRDRPAVDGERATACHSRARFAGDARAAGDRNTRCPVGRSRRSHARRRATPFASPARSRSPSSPAST